MKHFTIIDSKTFDFLLKLKTYNRFWYLALINCAKKNPKLANDCIKQACRNLSYVGLNAEGVNPFQVSKAANLGVLEHGIFDVTIEPTTWLKYRDSAIKRLIDESKLH